MKCSQARRILYPAPDKAAATIETARATGHLHECAACREYFADRAEWSRLLREKAGIEPAPQPLRDRVVRQIEQRTAGSTLRISRRTALVAGLLLLLLPAGWLGYRAYYQRVFEALCQDHAKYLNAESQVSSSNPRVIESWFRDKTPFGVRVPALRNAELLGGRLCFLKQRKAALVFYRKHGRAVSLFQFDASGVSLRALDRATIDGSPLWRMSFQGYSLAAFEHRGVVYVLVSDLREGELLELASAARMESRGY